MTPSGSADSGFLLVNLGKWTVDPIFDTFGDEVEDCEESGLEMEIPARDLDFGGYGMGVKDE